MLYRETVRGVALRMSMWASLAPKPIADQAGNGAHLHLSLWDVDGDGDARRNLFAGDGDTLPEIGRHFVDGLLAHLPALVALTCGTVNSVRHLAPRMWAGAYVCHGPDNREAVVFAAHDEDFELFHHFRSF